MDGQRTTGKRGLWRAMGLPLLLLVCLVNLLLLCLRYPDVRLDLRAGDVLTEDVLYPFTVVDAFRTDELRQAARESCAGRKAPRSIRACSTTRQPGTSS